MSPEAFLDDSAGRSDIRDVVERFYAAIAAKDPDALATVIDGAFASDVVLEVPDSLPHGGITEGVERIKRTFAPAASPDVEVGISNLVVERIVETSKPDEDEVVVEISFDWTAPGASQPVSSGAAEWWTFRGMQVRRIKTFYWDTAALAT